MESFIALDRALFMKVNHDWVAAWADWFFPHITDLHKSPWFSIPFCAGLLALFIYGYGRRIGLWVFGSFALSLGLSDLIGSRLVKPMFQRLRPPEAGLDLILRCPEYGGSSFPSNHATNMFCAFAFLSFLFPRMSWVFFIFAALVCYSRVYCGVHFPVDVIAGAIQGSIIGGGTAYVLLNAEGSPLRGLKWQRSS